jgi:hypothetical protein
MAEKGKIGKAIGGNNKDRRTRGRRNRYEKESPYDTNPILTPKSTPSSAFLSLLEIII